ncbi:MAG TPA: pitrilysin family protein [bacterium]|nr:pitrilysin family protein [bacterium]
MFKLENFGVTKNIALLNNGSKLFHFYKKNMPISTAVIFDAGSSNDPVGKEGLAHFCEHILFKSTKKFKDETEVGLFIESIGGQMNAFTGVDFLGVTAEIGFTNDFPKVVDFLHELTRGSLFDEAKINVERGTILGEIADYESNPAFYIHDLTQQLLFNGSYAERSIAGSKETVTGITREDLYRFYLNRIAKSKMYIVVAGDIEFSNLISLLNDGFKEGGTSQILEEKPELLLPRSIDTKIKEYKDTDQVYMSFSFRTCPIGSNDSAILDVVRTIIGDGFSSSLFRKLRTENGLVYMISVSSENLFDRGYFSVVTSTSKDRVQKVLDVLTSEFKRLEAGEISQEELDLAKNKIIKSKVREMQNSSSWVEAHISEIYFNPKNPKDLAEILNEVEKVSLDDVKNVSKKYFSNDKWYLAMCGDIGEKDFEVKY